MKKQIISKDDERLNVVVLNNEDLRIVAKGVARCHEEDTYDKEFGLKLANTRAWIKYYEKLGKANARELEYAKEILSFWEEQVKRLTVTAEVADAKYAEIKAEYDKMMETI